MNSKSSTNKNYMERQEQLLEIKDQTFACIAHPNLSGSLKTLVDFSSRIAEKNTRIKNEMQ